MLAQNEAERVSTELLLDRPSGKPVLAYLFVHCRTVPAVVRDAINARVVQRDTLTVERLLAIAANAVRPRRLALIETLGSILKIGNTRWICRALELLLRFASPDLAEVRKAVRGATLGDVILEKLERHTQSRELYLRFLAKNFADDPEWTLDELAKILADAIWRRSEEGSLDVLHIAVTSFKHNPGLVYAFEARAGLDRPDIQELLTSESVARTMGDLYRVCWQSEAVTIEDAIRDVTSGKRGLALTGRLNALADMLLEGTPETASRAFELFGSLPNPEVLVMGARITWTRCLPLMVQDWRPEDFAAFAGHAKELAGDVLAPQHNGHAEILFHVVRHGRFSKELSRSFLGHAALLDAHPWLDTRVLGHRLIEGMAAGIAGAESAFNELMRSPSEHQLLARAALVQLKAGPETGEAQSIALNLAMVTKNAEAALDLLKRSTTFGTKGPALIPSLRGMVGELRRTGNPKSLRRASNIQFELIRLKADPALDWDALTVLVQKEKDDMSMAQLIRALGLVASRSEASRMERLRWLVNFASDKGQYTRQAVLALCGRLSEHDVELASGLTEPLFDLAFREKTDGNLIEQLQAPLFILYRANDARALKLAEALIQRSAPLGLQTCHRVCGQFKRLFGLIVERMDCGARDRLLSGVPRLNKHLGRMIVEGVAGAWIEGLSDKLKAIVEHAETDPEIVTLANRFLHRELRISGMERWPELYEIVGMRQ